MERPPEERLASAVIDALPDATAVLDASGVIVAVNTTWRMFALDNGGDESATGVGVDYLEVCRRAAETGCDEAARAAADISAVLAGISLESEMEYPCSSPSVGRWFLLRARRLTGNASGAVLSHLNISRRKTAEESLTSSASVNSFTGLANRRMFDARLAQALAPSFGQLHKADVGIVAIHVDGLKTVKDTWGQAAGDEVLMTLVGRIRGLVGSGATVARLAHDEFVVLGAPTTLASASALASRIEQSLNRPISVHGHRACLSGSVGMHLATRGADPAASLRVADHTMRRVMASRRQTSFRLSGA